jgi:hypothetical protein
MMAMEMGTGIALGTLSVSVGAVFITAIRARKSEENGNGKIHPLCAEHSGVKACLDSIKEGVDRHEDWLKSIGHDVKELLKAK